MKTFDMKKLGYMSMLWISLALAAATLAGCKQSERAQAVENADVAIIESPKVGDLYAAELSTFSAATFNDGDEASSAKIYGLMKVIEVDSKKIVLITENAGAETPMLSKQDIKGDLSDIEFDEEEKIDVVRTELRKAYDSGKIYAVRR
jgi:hypothetical protein